MGVWSDGVVTTISTVADKCNSGLTGILHVYAEIQTKLL